MDNLLADLNKNGFVIIKDFYEKDVDLVKLPKEIQTLFALHASDFDPFTEDCMDNISEQQRSKAYSGLRYLPSLLQLVATEKNIDLCKTLGLQTPAIMHSYNLRMDLPNRPEFLFHWHQDTTYLLGSINALTFWVPLTSVNKHNGTIEIVPGSHLDGIKKIDYVGTDKLDTKKVLSPKDVRLQHDPNDDENLESLFIDAEPGDLVVFSQLLLHRSTPNCSNKIRWSAQLRYADFAEQRFKDNNYPMGNSTNIFNTDYMETKSE